MLKNIKSRGESKKFSVNFPKSLLDEIDVICNANYIARTAWILQASKEKLERDRYEKMKKLQENMGH
ncbi:hypothetical protein SZ25_00408 [Candidatus Arcanobacter lacustris]|uniref:CopG family transcriptional regulator n=1 Tax=Candidatus Arcanibacter lacustris TaxID=1607817 RepID=A0A0F5MR09_9RICK|nr:hypothetical protein SZ25_00408 [Candidatus Arcanobacter lacustris]